MKQKTKFGIAVLFFFLIASPLVAGQIDFNEDISPEDQETFDQILEPVIKIYNLMKYIASVIAVVVLLFAGIGYMTSGSDPKKRDNMKLMAMYVFIGLVIIWAAPIVVNFVVN